MRENFTRNGEQQGLQLPQYLRLVGKDQETFDQEIRSEAESRIRRTLALDAFANAENIGVDQQEVEDEVHRVASGTDDAAAVERLALANASTRQRVEEAARERKAMARLLQVATGDGRNGDQQPAKPREKTADRPETTDTETQSRQAQVAAVPMAEEEERGSA
jgi:trigger factor